MTTTALPQPTTDFDRALVDLDESGYCLLANALTADEVDTIRARVIEAALEDVETGRAFIDSGGANQRVWALLNRGAVFCELAAHPLGLKVMDHLVGDKPPYGPVDDLPNYLLGSITANIAGPSGEPMPLHSDQGYVSRPWPPFPLVANIAWMLDDYTAANGATRAVPGSHKLDAWPDAEAEARAVPVEGPAGTALVFDGRLWHGTGANTTAEEKRHGILTYYCRPWMRSQENHTVSTRPEVVASASPTLRRLMGFDIYLSLGMVDGLPPIGFPPAVHHQRSWRASSGDTNERSSS